MANTIRKYALITGASSGIGYELARLFAKDKYNLVIVARNEAELAEKAIEFTGENDIEVVTIVKDLSEPNAPFELYDEIKAKGIQVDVLVNNAAQGQYGKFVETDIQRELEMIPRINKDVSKGNGDPERRKDLTGSLNRRQVTGANAISLSCN
jgi:short-subunit dehydrogenase